MAETLNIAVPSDDVDAILAIKAKVDALVIAALVAAKDGVTPADFAALSGEAVGLITTVFGRFSELGVELREVSTSERYTLIRSAVDSVEAIENALKKEA